MKRGFVYFLFFSVFLWVSASQVLFGAPDPEAKRRSPEFLLSADDDGPILLGELQPFESRSEKEAAKISLRLFLYPSTNSVAFALFRPDGWVWQLEFYGENQQKLRGFLREFLSSEKEINPGEFVSLGNTKTLLRMQGSRGVFPVEEKEIEVRFYASKDRAGRPYFQWQLMKKGERDLLVLWSFTRVQSILFLDMIHEESIEAAVESRRLF